MLKLTILFLILKFSSMLAQDSLYLVATMSGENAGDYFSIVSGVGDINDDGFDDILVGAPRGNYAKLYLGGESFNTEADLKFSCDQTEAEFGQSLDGGRDLNDDGYKDIVIGAPSYIANDTHLSGMVFVYFGGPQMDTIPDLRIPGQGWTYNFGQSVAMAGDVNNDGFQDLVAGAPNDDFDARGRTYIYYGGSDIDSIADVLLEGEEGRDMFGWSVAGVGDVNKDGYDDVIIGAPQDLKGGPG